MRYKGSAGVLGARLLGLTQRLRPVPFPAAAPASLEQLSVISPIPGAGTRRARIAEISATPPAGGPTALLGGADRMGIKALDEWSESIGAPDPALEGARPV